VLADEIRRINKELDETRKSEDSFERQIKSLNQTKDRANKALQGISALKENSLGTLLGGIAGGTAVIITGIAFDSVTSVTFGGAAAIITHQTSTALEVTTPAGQTGVIDVAVTTSDAHHVTSTAGFTFT